MLPIVLLAVGIAAVFALYEKGHEADPVHQGVWKTLELHWQALWHHQEAEKKQPVDPAAAALHAGAGAAAQAQANATLAAAQQSVKTASQQDLVSATAAYQKANAALVSAADAFAMSPTSENGAAFAMAANAQNAAKAKLSQLTGKDVP